jgi:dihydroflavonol-4-reductase
MSRGTVLVTGASGFVASHCILQLLEQGYPVRGTLRDEGRAGEVVELLSKHFGRPVRMDFVRADLTSDAGWGEAVAGCAHVLHVASPIPLVLPKDPNALVVPARDGALRVLRAAKAAGIRRVVFTSSLAAIAYGHEGPQGAPYTEKDWTNLEGRDISAYVRSKAIAERAAWDYVGGEGRGLELVAINPGFVLGPVLGNDFGASPELIRQIMKRLLPAYPNIGFPIVDVRDVASAHLLAMTTPEAAGQRFVTAVDWSWMIEVGEVLRRAYPERRLPRGRLPDWLIKALSIFNAPLRQIVPELGRTRYVSNEKIRRVLGWRPRSNEEAILATAQTLIERSIV